VTIKFGLGGKWGTCLVVTPCYVVDAAKTLAGKRLERRRREVEVVTCAPYAAIHYDARDAIAFVMRSHFLATNRVVVRVGAVIAGVRIK